jgi:hypothetical protein
LRANPPKAEQRASAKREASSAEPAGTDRCLRPSAQPAGTA